MTILTSLVVVMTFVIAFLLLSNYFLLEEKLDACHWKVMELSKEVVRYDLESQSPRLEK